jgi:hypothetical protein
VADMSEDSKEINQENNLKSSNDLDWAYQNALRKQWLIDNPNAEYEGWMSI